MKCKKCNKVLSGMGRNNNSGICSNCYQDVRKELIKLKRRQNGNTEIRTGCIE